MNRLIYVVALGSKEGKRSKRQNTGGNTFPYCPTRHCRKLHLSRYEIRRESRTSRHKIRSAKDKGNISAAILLN